MSNSDLAALEKQIDKLCSGCVDEIGKEIKRCADTIEKQVRALAKEVRAIRIPDSMSEKELNELPGRVDQILKKNNARLKEGLARVIFQVSVDVEDKSIWVDKHGIGGDLAIV
jgi:hypothetical protein